MTTKKFRDIKCIFFITHIHTNQPIYHQKVLNSPKILNEFRDFGMTIVSLFRIYLYYE